MNGKRNDQALDCRDCRGGLQEYLDGTLAKHESLGFFLHLRDCTSCREEHDRMRDLFQMLDALPAAEAPADFDLAVLASVPYESYREMAAIRQDRVPVFLEESALPRLVRSPVVRLSGLAVSLLALAAGFLVEGTWVLPLATGLGLVPEALVRLQGLGRRMVLSARRAEG
jgi:anti-sigma factor RsiW